MRYFPNHLKTPEPCDDCGVTTRGWVNHDDGQPSDPERGPHAGEVPTMHPLCATCWVQWKEDGDVDEVKGDYTERTTQDERDERAQYEWDTRNWTGGEDAHLEMAYEDAQAPSGWDFV